jgi:hypothetical protein
MTAVILIAAGACLAALIAWVVISERLDPPPRDPPAGPGGGQHTARAGADDGFWAQHVPGPGRVEVLTGPGTRIRQTSETTASVLASGTGQLPMLPPDPEPDPTLMQPADVAYLGKPSGEYVDDLFAKHAGGES